MEDKEYSIFHREVLAIKDKIGISGLPLFRSNLRNVYSLAELKKDTSIFFYTDDCDSSMFQRIEDLEYVVESMGQFTDYGKLILGRIKSHIDFFRQDFVHQEAACDILTRVLERDSNLKENVRNEIYLLKNIRGEYCSFSDILVSRPLNTILYDPFLISGAIPANAKSWMIENPIEQWAWTKKNLNSLLSLNDWEENVESYLSDIQIVYNRASVIDAKVKNAPNLQIFLDEDGRPTQERKFRIGTSLLKEEYQRLVKLFPTGNLISPQFSHILTQPPFGLEEKKVKDLIANGSEFRLEDIKLLSFPDFG